MRRGMLAARSGDPESGEVLAHECKQFFDRAAATGGPAPCDAFVVAQLRHPYHKLTELSSVCWLQARRDVEGNRALNLPATSVQGAAILERVDEPTKSSVKVLGAVNAGWVVDVPAIAHPRGDPSSPSGRWARRPYRVRDPAAPR